jgi:hypothetical protein
MLLGETGRALQERKWDGFIDINEFMSMMASGNKLP